MIQYSIIQDDKTDYVAVRSTVQSFGLDHVTDKDVTSFFSSFSKYAHFDTGLLPLNGTGLLAYRQAANHSQIVIQHEPGVYRIMWGEHEGDSSAKHYFLAQPYRIVIGDIVDGSLLGARMFYSPVPITSPSNELYHVNLPNINCQGYRNNGVGWVCLYHNEDWSQIPIGEKVTRLMERCSGAEAYNDANMSETDGPRFYSKKGKPSYLSIPDEWEYKTQQEGFNWTLDPDLWIPILVADRDNQGQHDDNGVPLTLGMALTGDYRAYYYDKMDTKPVNSIAREDKTYKQSDAFALIKKAYIEAENNPNSSQKLDPYATSILIRSEYALTSKEKVETFTCEDCHEEVESTTNTYHSSAVCKDCLEEYYAYVDHVEAYVHCDDCVYIESQQEYYLTESDCVEICDNCGQAHHVEDKALASNDELQICVNCAPSDYLKDCSHCGDSIFVHPDFDSHSHSLMSLISVDSTDTAVTYYCDKCVDNYTVCPCGYVRQSDVYEHSEAPEWSLIATSDSTTCCKNCAIASEDGSINFNKDVVNPQTFIALSEIKTHNLNQQNKKVKSKLDSIITNLDDLIKQQTKVDNDDEPF